jgi:hypothetical protein
MTFPPFKKLTFYEETETVTATNTTMEKNDTPENLLPIREEPKDFIPAACTVCSDSGAIDGKLCPSCTKKEDQPAKQEPTRKLVLDELIEFLYSSKKSYGKLRDFWPEGNKNHSGFDLVVVSIDESIAKAQSLRKKEEENIKQAYFDGIGEGSSDNDNFPSPQDYLTQTYKTQ